MKSIRKIGQILSLYSAAAPEHGVSEISRSLGVSTSGAHDLVDGLAKIGLLQKVDRGRYRLGPTVASLYHILVDSSALIEAARPVMVKLVEDYGETVHLTVLDQLRIVVADALVGTQTLRVSRAVLGPELAPHFSPAGMLHLSTAGPERLAAYVATHANSRFPLLPKDRWTQQLSDVLQAGYASGPLLNDRDITCCAAQIRNHADIPVAVLSISVPRTRHEIQPRAFRTITMDAAQRISEAMGYMIEET